MLKSQDKVKEIIKPHNQLRLSKKYQTCIPSAVEMILKLEEVPFDEYNEQKEWVKYWEKEGVDPEECNFAYYDEKVIKGLKFKWIRDYHPNPKLNPKLQNDPDFKLNIEELFEVIDKELEEGRYVIISLRVSERGFHNFVIYKNDNGEYLNITNNGYDFHYNGIKSVKQCVIDVMGGTDILTYRKL